MPRFEQQGTLDEALERTHVPESEVRHEVVECPFCRCSNRVAVFAFSPQISKRICRSKGDRGCGKTFEVRTRKSVMDGLDDRFEAGVDKLETAKKASVSIRSRLARTKFGLAYILPGK